MNSPSQQGLRLTYVFVTATFLVVAAISQWLVWHYWATVMEPRLDAETKAETELLSQAQAHDFDQFCTLGGATPDRSELQEILSTALLLRHPTTQQGFFSGIALQMDYDQIDAPPGSLDLQEGEVDCKHCLHTEIPLFCAEDGILLGIAHFYVDETPYQRLKSDLSGTLFTVTSIGSALLLVVWIVLMLLVRRLFMEKLKAETATHTKSAFLANMSHEIRTPLNAITGLTRLALDTRLSKQQRDYLSKVDRSANSLLGIINDVLDFSKIEAGRIEIESIPFSLDEVLDNLATLLRVRAQDKGLELLFQRDMDVPEHLIGDPLRVGQILTNIVGNAVKFTEQGEVVVHIHKIAEGTDAIELGFEVRDTGIGISEQQIAKLFHSFSQADASTTREYGGTGLGLTISRQMVRLMGGDIQVNSTLKQGSCFRFSLHFKRNTAKNERNLQDVHGIRGLSALVVDDNPSARLIHTNYLKSLGLRVTEARDGEEAKRLACDAKESFGLVLLDWQMPGMNGLETASRIRECSSPDSPPKIILVSAYDAAQRDDKKQVIDFCLDKPLTPSTLFDGIAQTFGHTLTSPAAKHTSKTAENPASLTGARILLVEDVEINQQVAREMLEKRGLRVEIANHGSEALDKLRLQHYDCVLMDIQMPVMDGYTAAQLIRKQPAWQNLPVIAMTANAMAEDRKQAEKAGMNDHIAKPIVPEQLIETLMKWIPATPEQAQNNEQADFPLLESIDTAAGLYRLDQNANLYRRLLNNFAKDYRDAPTRMQRCFDTDDTEAAVKLAHLIKGLAATLGMDEVTHAAAQLEAAGHVSATLDQQHLQRFNNAIENAVEAIDTMPSDIRSEDQTSSVSAVTTDIWNEQLQQLQQLIQKGDLGAEELALKLRQQTEQNVSLSQQLDELIAHLEAFDFVSAGELLNHIRDSAS